MIDKLIKLYEKKRGEHPSHIYNLLNLYLFPIITAINVAISTYFFSKTINFQDPNFSIDEMLMNKILVFVIIFGLWIIIPLIGLIKKPFNVHRSNTLLFGSIMLYNVFLSNLFPFYLGFFLIISRNTGYGEKFKHRLLKSDTFNVTFHTIFPFLKK